MINWFRQPSEAVDGIYGGFWMDFEGLGFRKVMFFHGRFHCFVMLRFLEHIMKISKNDRNNMIIDSFAVMWLLLC